MRKIALIFLLLCGLTFNSIQASLFDYSGGREGHKAMIRLPKGDNKEVKALLYAHQNMTEEVLFRSKLFTDKMDSLGVAMAFIQRGSQNWDPNTDCQQRFESIMQEFSDSTGHPEITTAPVIPFGHSAQATFPWNFAAWNPERTLCIISYHGDAPRTNLCGYGRENVEWGRTRNIDRIPGLMIEGEYEWWEARVNPALAFRIMYPESRISFLCDAGKGHFDLCEDTQLYIAKFIENAINEPRPTGGVYYSRWREDGTESADPHDMFWYQNQEMADWTKRRYDETRGKKMQYVSAMHEGQLLKYDPQSHIKIRYSLDGDEFTLDPVFVDEFRSSISENHSSGSPRITLISGPAVKSGEYTFRYDPDYFGLDPQRLWDGITLCVEADGDDTYKPAVQELVVYLNPGKHRPEVKAQDFSLKDVKLLPSRFHENMERDSVWMANIDIDRLLHSFYNNAGVWGGKEGGYMTVKKYGGWESMDCELRGHITGHLMSAYAQMYASTGADIFKDKGDSIVAGLSKAQRALGNGYLSAFPEELINRNIRGEAVWAPWYTLHKILAGLIDQHLIAGNDETLAVAKQMGNWAYDKVKNIDEETRRKMLRNEFGGINEAFYNLYALTGDEKYKEAAEFFYHNEVIDPLKEKNPDFGTKHTNTFIPKVIGEIRRYELSGDHDSFELSRFFWDEMLAHHIFAPGCLSDKEHYFPTDKLSEHISGYTGETCCTYNMLKLGRHLFAADPTSDIFDYYERALYNHILGQQDPATGMVAYFLPLASGSHKVYSTPENSFWCCVGSGFENHSKYGESIYFKSTDDKTLYVNLFIPSELNWREKGMKLIQTNNFPSEASTRIVIDSEKPAFAQIKLRYPVWTDGLSLRVNGKEIKIRKGNDGYVAIQRKWKKGDRIDIDFDISLKVESPSDNSGLGALVYGPVVLAGRLGTQGMVAPAPDSDPGFYNDYYTYDYHIPEGLPTHLNPLELRKTGPLSWETPEGVKVEPLYDIHRERYVVYWNISE